MKRDEMIDKKLDEYVEGVEAPEVDLSAARAELGGQVRRKKSRRRALFAALSACACVLLVAVLAVFLFPTSFDRDSGEADMPSADEPSISAPGDSEHSSGSAGDDGQDMGVYSLDATVQSPAGLNELSEKYGSQHEKLIRLGFTLRAEYTIYRLDGRDVLLRADIVYSQEGARVQATVWADLTGGERRADALTSFSALSHMASKYTYETEQIAGEYLSRGNFTDGGRQYCVEVQSSRAEAFHDLMTYLM